MDGFLHAGNNDLYSIGYYGEADIPFYASLAQNYTTCDRYFASILGPTFPNRLFLHAAQTDRLDDSVSLSSDRKSTRLNSSHGYISYAVFCLKKKNKEPSAASAAAVILNPHDVYVH